MTETTGNTLEALIDGNSKPEATVSQPETQQEPAKTGDKPEAPEPPADAAQPQDDGPRVPLKALEDERRKRQEFEKQFAELQRQMQALQQPKPQVPQPQAQPDLPPDPWTDPEGAIAWHNRQQQRAIYETRVVMSEELMSQKPDYAEMKQEFFEAITADPSLAHKLVAHPMPAKFVYEVGKKHRAEKRIGNDPDAFEANLREQIRQELMAELGTQPSQAQAPRAPAPKSLAGATSTQPRDPKSGRYAPSNGPVSLEDIIG